MAVELTLSKIGGGHWKSCHNEIDILSGQIVEERGGTASPFRFWRGNAVPLAYTTAVGGRVGTWRRVGYPHVHSIIS